ncbi:hypothetical protein JR316_0001270 [Psilocybe cubensis]|uniref:Uncharacterized protein n=2 Tax=Psilocybe cubensis TaxID=181762 RepID=A0ACB8HH85_PSICU|nr:hypothetical protein JR316_0001270 [Psilocybe cubensis]KAH9487201.1 hypothetical protein JR316_0001270 [Psilocybe cubensis]
MSSSSTSTSSLTNILTTIRRANERVSRLAASMRASLTPTHHARRRARKLQLRVCIDKALKLDPKQISVIPLPVLATPVPLPVPEQVQPVAPAPVYAEPVVFRENEISRAAAGRELERLRNIRVSQQLQRPTLRCEIPADAAVASASVSTSELTDMELETPVEHDENQEDEVHAPVVLRGQNVPWRPVTSRWSVSTVASEPGNPDIAIEDADIVDAAGVYSTHPTENEEEQEQDRHTRASAYEEGTMDFPITVSPDSPEGPYGALEYTPSYPRSRLHRELDIGGDTRRVLYGGPRRLTVPLRLNTDLDTEMDVDTMDVDTNVDSSRLSWGSASSSSSSSSSGSQSATSESGSTTSESSTDSSSPVPSNSDRPKLTIRIKRSAPIDLSLSLSSSSSSAESDDTRSLSEKRPKYGRKSWASPYPVPAPIRATIHPPANAPVPAPGLAVARRQSARISAQHTHATHTNRLTTTTMNRSSNRF